jgi:hypothetical protein
MNRLNTAIFIFDGVEVLDFAGPFEAFSRTRLVPGVESRRSDSSAPFNVFTVARLADKRGSDPLSFSTTGIVKPPGTTTSTLR